MEKLNLGRKIEFLEFQKFTLDNNNYRNLLLHIVILTSHLDTILYLREINGEIKPFISNNKNPFDKDYYREDIRLDNGLVKKYLDLFEKYSLFLESYNYLKNYPIFGDGTYYMFTIIDEYKSNLLEGLNKFGISFGFSYYNVDMVINLGENFGLDYDNCKLQFGNDKKEVFKEDYENLLTKAYINKRHLKE